MRQVLILMRPIIKNSRIYRLIVHKRMRFCWQDCYNSATFIVKWCAMSVQSQNPQSSLDDVKVGRKGPLTDNKPRLRWACRRGMLELDVLFRPFVDEAYDDLADKDKIIFERLLVEQDPELFAWFMGHKICEDKELNAMVQFILNRVKV